MIIVDELPFAGGSSHWEQGSTRMAVMSHSRCLLQTEIPESKP